jgi:hypothetical protein
MKIYSGKVTAKEIKELTSEAEKILIEEKNDQHKQHEQHENLSDQENIDNQGNNCVIGDDGICKDHVE